MHRHHRTHPRPPSVTFLGIALVVTAVSLIVIGLGVLLDPNQTDPWIPCVQLVRAVIYGVTGGFLLAGKNWARFLFVAVCLPVSIALLLFQQGASIIGALFVAAILGTRLFSRPANLYFTGRSGEHISRGAPSVDRDSEHARRGRFNY